MQKYSVSLGPLLYLDCVDFGMSDEEIASKFDATVLELQKEKTEWNKYNRANKLTFKKYLAHKRRRMTEKGMMERYKISSGTIRRREREWRFMGLLEGEVYKSRQKNNAVEQVNREGKRNKISLIEFATLRDLKYSDLEISSELNISIATLNELKKEWQELGLLDAVGQVVSKSVKALPLETFKEYTKRSMSLEQIANYTGLKVETVREYFVTWKNLGLLESTENTLNLQLQQLKSDYAELRKKYTVLDREKAVLSQENLQLAKKIEEQAYENESVSELKRSRDALVTEAKIDAQKISSLEKEVALLKTENERLSAGVDKEIEKRQSIDSTDSFKKENEDLKAANKVLEEKLSKLEQAVQEEGDLKQQIYDIGMSYEKSIERALEAIEFYGEANYKYAAKLGLAEVKEILKEVL